MWLAFSVCLHGVSSLKWKPPSENSVDFKLTLRFPPSKSNPSMPDFCAKPFFGLHVYCGEERGQPVYEPYDKLYVKDDEWREYVRKFALLSCLTCYYSSMKLSGEQVDDRIVEVHWDPELSSWRKMRFRDDKPHGNYRTIVEKIIQSIADGVEKPTVS